MKTTRIEKTITKIGIISLAALAAIGILASLIGACGIDLDIFVSTPVEDLFYFILLTLSILVAFCLPASFLTNISSIAASLRVSCRKAEKVNEENL
jgi:hypothetical protein